MVLKTTFFKFNKHEKIFFFLLLLGVFPWLKTSGQSVCTPTNQYGKCCSTTSPIGASEVKFGSQFTQTNSYSASQNYYDYFGTTSGMSTVSACVTAGSKHALKLTPLGTTYQHGVCAWIDWNNDNSFSSGEIVMSYTSVNTGQSKTDTVTIPSSQSAGSYRMRVLMDYYYYYAVNGQAFNPCQSYYGDYLDFKINVIGASGIDAAAISISPIKLAVGNNNMTLKFMNAAATTIDSCTVGYQLSGQSAFTERISGLNLTSCNSYTHAFSQALNISTGGKFLLKAWVTSPNATSADDKTSNDTIQVSVCTGLYGNFTIDKNQAASTTNFVSFNDAFNDLNNCGITGPVTFTVAAGTYAENAVLNAVNGSSSTNTITFNGVDKTTRVISKSQAGPIIRFNGTDYVTWKNLSIENTYSGSSLSWAMHITNGSDFITVDSCTHKVTGTSSSNYCFGVMSSTGTTATYNVCSNITYKNSESDGGYYSTLFIGNSANRLVNSNISNVKIHNFQYYGLWVYYGDTVNVLDNRITYLGTGTGYPFYVYYNSNIEVQRNISTGGYYGWYLYYNSNVNAINNMVSNSRNYTCYSGYNTNCNFYHNTLFNDATTGTVYTYYQNQGSVNNQNNVYMNNSSLGYAFYAVNANILASCDYNNYYAPNSSRFVYIGRLYANPAALQGANNMNNVVYNQNPNFISNTTPYDLHISSAFTPLVGNATLGVTVDVDGDARCSFAPTIGADESKYQWGTPLSNFVMPDTHFVNSPVTILNSAGANEGKGFEWYIDGSSTPDAVTKDLQWRFGTTGTHTVKLRTRNCSGSHDTTFNIVIIDPPTAPIVDFIANKNVIPQNDQVVFTNLTTGGDTAWLWEITPGTMYTDWEFDADTNVNPIATFYTPGKYNVCLTAFNSKGSTKVCKSIYIEVVPVVTMCQTTYTTEPNAQFFDDGGKYGNYSTGNCTMLIDPCASEVTMSFTKFKVNTTYGTLRVYDGSDATGKPLHSGTGFTGTTLPPDLIAKSGKMYIDWRAGTSTAGLDEGWEASWSSKKLNAGRPSADFTVPSTIYEQAYVWFTVKNYDPNVTYSWDFDGSGTIDDYGRRVAYQYFATGTYDAMCIATSCGGVDTVIVRVNVIAPSNAPGIDFKVDFQNNIAGCLLKGTNKVNVNIGDTLILIDNSTEGPTSWDWSITPTSGVTWIGANTDQNPAVTFTASGSYDVRLDATNIIGTGTGTKNGFVTVKPNYCNGSVSSLIADLGINVVKLGAINNATTSGVDRYSNYSSKYTTCLASGGRYTLSVERSTNKNVMSRMVWIDYNQDGDFDDQGEMVASDLGSTASVFSTTLVIPAFSTNVLPGFTRMRVGAAFGKNPFKACGPILFGEYEDYGVFLTDDNEGPVITITPGSNGLINQQVQQGTSYTDAGATATDNLDTAVTVTSTVNVNVNVPGMYSVTYSAVDRAGNKAATQVRTVEVIANTSAPTITLNGTTPMDVEVNTTYTEPGATATHPVGGTATVNISGTVNTAVLGTYWMTYSACWNGYCDSVKREVRVRDGQAPVITLSSTDTVEVEVFGNFTFPTATVNDNYYTGLTATYAPSTVNTSVLGTQMVTYSSTDGSGNVGTKVLYVIVVDKTAPTITLNMGDTVYAEVNTSFVDPGATATDNYYPNVTVSVTGGPVNTGIKGSYILTYTATDGSGNLATRTRTVIVRKTTKPVITLNPIAVQVARFSNYNDAGINVVDNYYTNAQLQPKIVKGGTFTGTSIPGVFTITYQVTDDDGNISDIETRIVIVNENVSITDVVADAKVDVFPNPANQVVNIRIQNSEASSVKVQVLNAVGQVVRQIESNHISGGNYQLDMSDLANGVYFLNIQANNKATVVKVQVLH